ncbi:MAG: long-chain-acyl-CoA synthetase [Pseudomonadota bacterium]
MRAPAPKTRTSSAVLSTLKREYAFVSGLGRTLLRISGVTPDAKISVASALEQSVDAHRNRPALLFHDNRLTYGDWDARANRYAHWALAQGLGAGDVVALAMQNRPEYLCAWFGLAKAGVAAALVNANLTGRALAHSLNAAGAKAVVAGEELAGPLAALAADGPDPSALWFAGDGEGALKTEAHDRPAGSNDLDAALAGQSAERPDPDVRASLEGRDVAFLIYTSGTTGLPKAARLSAARVLTIMRAFAAIARSRPDDVVYSPLPLYHTVGGIMAPGIALTAGAAFATREHFSAHGFWTDCERYGATIFQYVGELCRYLVNSQPTEAERRHKLRVAIGNGLRPDVWETFESRFKIPQIREYYGSTEGNITIINYDGKPGAIGRVPPYAQPVFGLKLVKFDPKTEQPVRGPDGKCVECAIGEAGEAIGKIDTKSARKRFDGYTDKESTEKKVLRGVFQEDDAWFRTGDLMRRDALGYFYFVDRIGDTFRWKGENVSTAEVSQALSSVDGVREINVYGVQAPGHNGRAGMAAVVSDEGFSLDALHAQAEAELPKYARPLFLRMQAELASTSTFKQVKGDLVKEGFDPNQIEDRLYFDHPEAKAYVPLTAELYQAIVTGDLRI